LAEQPMTFPTLYVASVRASERTGALREALTRYIAYAEQADALRKTLVNACIYPVVLLGVGLLVMLFLLGYVVPRFSAIYEDVGTDLPAASRVLLQWGQLMDAHGGLMALGLAACLSVLGYAVSRASTRARVGAWIAAIPSVGHQLHIYQLARLYRTTGMLLRGGMPAVAALEMSAGLLRADSRQAYAAATRAVREGQSLAQAMESNGLTTPVASRMLRVGERSGNMGEMMERIASFCDEELARWVAIVTRLIEPVLMTVIGLVIGVIVVLMYFPIFQLAGSIR
jgi:general secretion pathway protein F